MSSSGVRRPAARRAVRWPVPIVPGGSGPLGGGSCLGLVVGVWSLGV